MRADGRAAGVARPPYPRILGIRTPRLARKHCRYPPRRTTSIPRVSVEAGSEFLRNCGAHRSTAQTPGKARRYASSKNAWIPLAAQRRDLSPTAGDVAFKSVATG